MELKEYIALVRKWWWLLLLCTLLGGGAAYVVSNRMERTYEASTLLMVGGSMDVLNPTQGDMQTSQRLLPTYAELVKTSTVLDATVAALNLPTRPRVSVSLVSAAQLLRITVADSRPDRAAATADELARQLILQSPSAPQRQEQAYREFVNSQLRELEAEMNTLSKAILSTKESGGDQETIMRLEAEMNVRRANYSALLAYIKDLSTNYVRVVDPAQVPTTPTKPKVLQNTLLAAVVGLMLAAGAALLIEYLDDSVKGQDDIEQVLGLPTLASIASVPSNGTTSGPITLADPKSPFAEAYRMLRTNLRYSVPASTSKRVFLITSVGPKEGKSTIVSNLGVAMAQGGYKTILVDSDLHRPRLHKLLGCPNELGLTSLLVGEVDSLDDVLQPTEVEGLFVLPSGPLPPNAAELLGSPRMLELLDELSERADIVILDSPPVLAVTDASILASMATGTIMVVEVGQTRLDACVQGVEALRKVGGNLLGVALNRLDVKRRGYYYYYHYYHAYDEGTEGNGRKKETGHRSARAAGRKGQNDSEAQDDAAAQAEPTNSEAPKTRHHSARKTRLTFKLAAFNLLHHKEHRKSSQDQRERDA